MQNSISVIIPVYNRRDVVCRAINSALSQSLKAEEIIVVDDGSTDGTYEKIKHDYPDVQTIRIDHSGVSAARNAGIKIAKGEWIAFLDSDDEWKKDKLKIQMDFIKKYPEIVFFHTDEKWVRKGKVVNPPVKYKKSGGDVFFNNLPITMIGASTVMIKKTAFESIGLFDEKMPVCEDYDLWLRMSLVYPVGYIDEKLTVKYGGNPCQLSLTIPHQDEWRIYSLVKLLTNNELNAMQDKLIAVKLELKKKIDIVLNGLRKKEMVKEIQHYEKILKDYNI